MKALARATCRLLLAAVLALSGALAGVAARAQTAPEEAPATLVADRVEIRADTALVAEGNVEVLWNGVRLRAARIVYDGAAGSLSIAGPITLTDGDRVAVFAEAAELSTDLRDGIMRSARFVLDRQLQLAATELVRVQGRYTELSKVVASSCQVCAARPVPLWSIRARRVVHDAEARQLYFDGAQFRVLDLPVFYLPRLRLPDPTLERSTGLLFPTFRTTSKLGAGLKLPYFVTLGRSADVTLTPYLSPKTRTLGFRYRQAFRRGGVIVEGAVTDDDILAGRRGYLFGEGAFALPRDFVLRFDVQAVSDRAYLVDYGISDADRLKSGLRLTRVRRDERIEAGLTAYETLRAGEVNGTQPGLVWDAAYERRFVPPALGGVATLSLGTLGTRRASALDGAGRDTARIDARLGWERTAVVGPGLLVTGAAGLRAAAWDVREDSAFDRSLTVTAAEAAVTLRWPLIRRAAGRATDLIEPVAQVAWTSPGGPEVPNEDSTLVEADEGNLLAFSRFPGEDAREAGTRAAVGVSWTRHTADGLEAALTFGRILRDRDRGLYTAGSGLDGAASHWLVSGRLDLPGRVSLRARALVDDGLSPAKADLRLAYTDARFDLGSGFTYLTADPAENRPADTSEWSLDAAWRIDANWTGRTAWRYDFEADRATSAGLGLGYRNECLKVDLSLSRRFTSSTSVSPTTDFGLSVELAGFGTGGQGGAPRHRCVN